MSLYLYIRYRYVSKCDCNEFRTALECNKASNLRDKAEVVKAIKTSIGSMQYGNEDFLAGLVAEACGKTDISLY